MIKSYTVIEEQRNEAGTTSALATPTDSYAVAESTYYAILSAAAISNIPYHAAYLLEANKGCIMCKFYDRSEATAE